MTDEDLQAIEQRAAACPPGPWREDTESIDEDVIAADDSTVISATVDYQDSPYVVFGDARNDGDAIQAFVFHAREDVLALVAEVRRLQAEIHADEQDGMDRNLCT